MRTKDILINALLFQLCWFTAVLAGGYWALLPLGLMFGHYCRVLGRQALGVVLALSLFGMAFDSLYLYLGVYQVTSLVNLPLLNIPLWLACLWLAFCLCLPLSLAWLVKKNYIFVLACAILGPVSYLAGRQLEVIDFSESAIAFLALEWGIFAFVVCLFLLPSLTGTAQTNGSTDGSLSLREP